MSADREETLDPEDEGEYAVENPWGFIPLDGGKLFLRQSEIVGLRWVVQNDLDDDALPAQCWVWHLEAFVENVGKIHLYGEDCVSVLRTLGLPEEPPDAV